MTLGIREKGSSQDGVSELVRLRYAQLLQTIAWYIVEIQHPDVSLPLYNPVADCQGHI
jgi:hypothetical protein